MATILVPGGSSRNFGTSFSMLEAAGTAPAPSLSRCRPRTCLPARTAPCRPRRRPPPAAVRSRPDRRCIRRPAPRAPRLAAAMMVRPSPEPRSITKSCGVTLAWSSIFSTIAAPSAPRPHPCPPGRRPAHTVSAAVCRQRCRQRQDGGRCPDAMRFDEETIVPPCDSASRRARGSGHRNVPDLSRCSSESRSRAPSPDAAQRASIGCARLTSCSGRLHGSRRISISSPAGVTM